MLKTYTFTAGGRQWRGTQLPARRAYDLLKRLAPAILPALGGLLGEGARALAPLLGELKLDDPKAARGEAWEKFKTLDVGAILKDLDVEALGASAGALARAVLEYDKDDALVDALLYGLEVQIETDKGLRWVKYRPGDFDQVFSGALPSLFVVVGHVLKENYGDFLGK